MSEEQKIRDLLLCREKLKDDLEMMSDRIKGCDGAINNIASGLIDSLWREYFRLNNLAGNVDFGYPGDTATFEVNFSHDGIILEWDEFGDYGYRDHGYGLIPWDYIFDVGKRVKIKEELRQKSKDKDISRTMKEIETLQKRIEELKQNV